MDAHSSETNAQKVLDMARSAGDVPLRNPTLARSVAVDGRPGLGSPNTFANTIANPGNMTPEIKRRGMTDSTIQSIAQGKRALWALNGNDYSSLTMKMLLQKQGNMEDGFSQPANHLAKTTGTLAGGASIDPFDATTHVGPPTPQSARRRGGRRMGSDTPTTLTLNADPFDSTTYASPMHSGSGSRKRAYQGKKSLNASPVRAYERRVPVEAFPLVSARNQEQPVHVRHMVNSLNFLYPDPSSEADHLAQAREHYHKTYSGLQASGATGMTVLEELIDAAFRACDTAYGAGIKHPTGAALLVRDGNGVMYSGCNVVSVTKPGLTVSAERTVILKAVSDGHSHFQGLVIVNATRKEIPVPDGDSRQFLAEYGDFPIYLVNKNMEVQRTSTFELYPLGQRAYNHRNAKTLDERIVEKHRKRRKDLQSWNVEDVADWLEQDVQLPQYRLHFARMKVNGPMLLQLEPQDLTHMDITHSLHRRRILSEICVLKEEAEKQGDSHQKMSNLEDFDEFMATLDRDRIKLIAKLKAVFDKHDEDDDGKLTIQECRLAFAYLGRAVNSSQVSEWFEEQQRRRKGGVTTIEFSEFASGYSTLFEDEDPDIRAGDGELKKRIQYMRETGHVKINPSSPRARERSKDRRRDGWIGATSSSDSDRSSLMSPGARERRKRERNAQQAAEFEALHSVSKLAETKRIFDRFAINDKLTASEAVQALLEVGCTAPRVEMTRYMRKRGFLGIRRQIGFFEFLHAYASLGVEESHFPKQKDRRRRRFYSSGSDDDEVEYAANRLARSVKESRNRLKPKTSRPHSRRRHKYSSSSSRSSESDSDSDSGYSRRSSHRSKYGRSKSRKHSKRTKKKKKRHHEKRRHFSSSSEESNSASSSSRRSKRRSKSRGRRRKKQSSSESDRGSRRVSASRGRRRKPSRSSSEEDKRGKFRSGDKVEARYQGRGKYYKGVIARALPGRKYDIDYDDGEKETKVEEKLIRKLEGGSDPDTGGLTVGTTVEARYRGKLKYYPGKISRAHLDGTYDIDYDDGEKETQVDQKLIRVLEKAPRSPRSRGGSPRNKKRGGGEYEVGQKIEARYRGKAKYYPGKISRAHLNGTYDINYDDGEQETGVEEKLIRPVAGGDSSGGGSGKMKEGDKVEAKYRGKAKYYPGVISCDRGDGTYDVDYDDGEKEFRVDKSLIRLVKQKPGSPRGRSRSTSGRATKSRGGKLRMGSKVEARYRGKAKYYPGKITRCRLDGTYDIDYDDGEKETKVDPDLVRSLDDSDDGGTAESTKPKKTKGLRVGTKVEARYRGKAKYYPGKISRVHMNGTYDVDYDDGEKETKVAADLIRSLDSGAGSEDSLDDALQEGMKVEARYKGKAKYYPGTISRCRSDGTYDIDYDDGEQEKGVEGNLIRKSEKGGARAPQKASSSLQKGSKVEARYKGKSKYYPGVISRVRPDGSFDIDYNDGEKEMRVDESLIRSLEKENVEEAGSFEVGDKVEARYRGKAKYYPGQITRIHLNGTYDINYDDGEKETKVEESLIRSLGGKKPAKATRKKSGLRVGSKVEARYRGKAKYYPGKVSRVNLDGTYNIDYDDGEKETKVEESLIRSLEGGSAGDEEGGDGASFEEGQKVEARYRGKTKYYPGTISRARFNGTFDIDYDDGEKENGVKPELIRALDGGGGTKKKNPSGFKKGQKVEARYKGKSKYYPGKISRVCLRGGYDVDYDDGEQEKGVDASLIRSLEDDGSNSGEGQERFATDQKVEARYRGKAKWYPGKIARARANGTYDIDYDDGEQEKQVEASLIRAVRKAPSPRSTRSSPGNSGRLMTVGDKVEARYRGKSKYYPGVISKVNHRFGTYDIDYDDGEKETGVQGSLVRQLGGEDDSPRKGKGGAGIRVGTKVEARYRGKAKYYPGKISRVHLDGTYNIDYDDGEKETKVEENLIRVLDGGDEAPQSPQGGKKSSGGGGLKRGQKIEARYRGKSKYYPGTITRVRLNGTYDIDYDDGEKETGVQASLVRQLGGEDDSPRKGKGGAGIRVGAKVEARYRGKAKYYPGKVSQVHLDGTYNIDYDDGEKETKVEENLIRVLDGGDEAPQSPRGGQKSSGGGGFKKGQKIEARYRGKSKYYPGTITRVRLNGTYDIDYDDGEQEKGVEGELIKSLGGDEDEQESDGFQEGMKVEARYRGKMKYYPGTISRVRRDGTCDIDYDDGEQEKSVEKKLIRPVRSAGGGGGKSGGGLQEGQKVEARYRGKTKYYPGVISRVWRDGTCDIDYDDGEKETRVEQSLIRAKDGVGKTGGGGGSKGTFKRGMKVEARYRGKAKFYPGTISRVHLDGTFDVDYDDGEQEKAVEASLIRSLEGSGGAGSPPVSPVKDQLREGTRCEARYKGKARFYPGVISRARPDGTYDIDYDDGEQETRVAREMIKTKAKPMARSPGSSTGGGAARRFGGDDSFLNRPSGKKLVRRPSF